MTGSRQVKDYYAILGVSPTATLAEIRVAYRERARAFHPDLNSSPEAEARFLEINEAYEILADATKRKAYDYFVSVAQREASESGEASAMPHVVTAQERGEETPGETSTVGVPPSKSPQERGRRPAPPPWAVLLIVLGICIVAAVAVGAFLSLRQPHPSGGAEAVTVSKVTTFTSPLVAPESQIVLEDDGVPLRVASPSQLEVAGLVYPVAAVIPEEGHWPVPAQDENLALWIHGTVVNYVIGLPYNPGTLAALSGLSSQDRLTLTLDSGTKLIFGLPEVVRIDPSDVSPMTQDRPGMTLAVLGGEESTRLLVRARYLPEAGSKPGETTIAGVAVRVLGSEIVEDVRPLEVDSWYVVVDYQVTNTTSSVLQPLAFDLALEDSDGYRYILNETATALGTYGKLEVALSPGETARGSAGYVIPATARFPLIWVFRPDPSLPDDMRVVLDLTSPAPAEPLPEVMLLDAFWDPARAVVVLSGQVTNNGDSLVGIERDQVKLTSPGQEYALVAATPLLPWRVQPATVQQFELQFEAPRQPEAVLRLTIAGFEFEIE